MNTDSDGTEGRQHHGTLPQHEAAAMRLFLALDGNNIDAMTWVLDEVLACQDCAAATLMSCVSLALTALRRWPGWQDEMTERVALVLDAQAAAESADSP